MCDFLFCSGFFEIDGNEEWRKGCQISYVLCGIKFYKCKFILLNYIENVGFVYKVLEELKVNYKNVNNF